MNNWELTALFLGAFLTTIFSFLAFYDRRVNGIKTQIERELASVNELNNVSYAKVKDMSELRIVLVRVQTELESIKHSFDLMNEDIQSIKNSILGVTKKIDFLK